MSSPESSQNNQRPIKALRWSELADEVLRESQHDNKSGQDLALRREKWLLLRQKLEDMRLLCIRITSDCDHLNELWENSESDPEKSHQEVRAEATEWQRKKRLVKQIERTLHEVMITPAALQPIKSQDTQDDT